MGAPGQGDGETITGAEFFVDDVDFSGNGIQMTLMDGNADGASEDFYHTYLLADFIIDHSAGTHTIYVHGRTGTDTWGPFESISFWMFDKRLSRQLAS